MTTLRAHFDGRVLVPHQQVDLPRDCELELRVREVGPAADDKLPFEIRDGIPVIKVPPGSPPIKMEDVKRWMEDEH